MNFEGLDSSYEFFSQFWLSWSQGVVIDVKRYHLKEHLKNVISENIGASQHLELIK